MRARSWRQRFSGGVMFLCCLVMVPEANGRPADIDVIGKAVSEAGWVIGLAAACSENTQSSAARLLGSNPKMPVALYAHGVRPRGSLVDARIRVALAVRRA